ncbi:IPT/TIG domain-containing protein [Paraphysoderma sedebokerense]|nr:IPT/TIG domain-containing protein [Paraphysoderma sedebokerense]
MKLICKYQAGGTQLRFICQNVAENGLLKQVDIKVGGKPCTNQIKEMLYFTCLVPPGIGTKNSISVRFLGNEGTANVTFSYDPPQIDSVQPNNALPTGGSEISVIGKNFGAGLDPSVHVTIGGRNCNLLSVTHNKITCVTPPGVGQFLDVFVSVSGQNITASAVFYYLPPDIMTIYPTASKDSNAVMIIRGSNFGNDSSQVAVIFTSSNGTTYQPCSNIALIGESFSDILNCTLDGLLPKPAIYNVRVSIKIGGQTSLGTHQFETGSEKKPPVAIPQNYTVLEDSRFVFRLEGNLPNVNDTIEFYITSLPIHGQLFKNDNDFSALNLDVNFGSALVPSNLTELLYIPHLDFNGTDTFDFQLCNSYFCGTSVEIILNVLPLNDPPVVSNHSFTIDEDLTVEITLNYSDVDSMAQGIQMVVATLPLGTLFDGSNPVTSVPYILTNNSLLYTPSTNRHGQPPQYHYSNFTYMAYDGVNYSITPGIITLNVRPLDDFPVASNIFVEIDRSPTVLIYLECVDIDTAPSNLLLRIKKLPVNGTLYAYNSLTNSPGDPLLSVVDDERRRVWFIPSRDFIGRTEFLYECIDHNGAVSNTATVEISVNPVIDCAEEIVFSSEFVEGTVPLYPIDLSNRKVISERHGQSFFYMIKRL